ncbi:MAG: hydrogenase nickel incorporation protein HypB [Bacilli bacterium]|nr:hydrogenase nickel incorporation protein HypB [Bacilli bacterium]
MEKVKFIDLKSCILQENDDTAAEVRKYTKEKNVFLWNIMSSPGSGKTTFITKIIELIGNQYRIGVIEADIESTYDSEKLVKLNVPTVQLRTGGGCHLEACMVMEALKKLPLDDLDIVIVENVGNLVCPAEFDIGADFPMMLLSVPEGEDKAIKYPLMFTVTDALVVTKIDALPFFDFNFDALNINCKKLNSKLKIFSISAKTGENCDQFVEYLLERVNNKIIKI